MRFLKSFGTAVAYLVIYFLVCFIVIGIDLALHSNGLAGTESKRIQSSEAILLMSNAACLVVYILIIKFRKRSIKERLDLRPFSKKKAVMLLVLGVLLNILISYALVLLPIPVGTLSEYSESVSRLDTESLIGVINAIIMAPIFEEVMTRGLILKSLMKGMPAALALILQGLLFGLLHGQIVWVIYAAVTGILLGLVRLRCNSLFASILLHFSLNAANYILGPLYEWAGDSYILASGLTVISLAAAIFLIRGVLKKEPVTEIAASGDMAETA